MDGGDAHLVATAQGARQHIAVVLLHNLHGVENISGSTQVIPHGTACSLQLGGGLGRCLRLSHFIHLLIDKVTGCLGRLHHSGSLLARVLSLALRPLHTATDLALGLLLKALVLLAQAASLLALLLHLHAADLQLLDHALKGLVLGTDHMARACDNSRGKPQLFGNSKGVGLAGCADNETIGGTQGLHVKLAGGVAHAGGIQRVGLQLGVVGSSDAGRTGLTHRLDDGHGQRRALYGVGATTQLVKEHKGAGAYLGHNGNDVDHMGGEGGKGLLDALLVTKIHQNVIKGADTALLAARDVQTRLGHESKKSHGLERNRLTTGVRAGDDQSVKAHTKGYVDGHHTILVNEGMACLHQVDRPIARDDGRDSAHLRRELTASEGKGEVIDVAVVQPQGVCNLTHSRRQLGEDALDLPLLAGLEHTDLVIGVHHRHGLDKNGGTRGGGVVDKTLDLGLALGLDGDDIAPAAHGDDVLLQIASVARDKLLQGLLDLGVLIADLAANVRQERRGLICDHVLGGYSTGDAILHAAIHDQAFKHLVQHRLKGMIAKVVVLQAAGRTQDTCAVQQLAGRKNCSLLRPLAGGRDITHAAEGGCALGIRQAAGIRGAAQATKHGMGVLRGAEIARQRPRALGLTHGLQHGADLIKFQCSDSLFGKAHSRWIPFDGFRVTAHGGQDGALP